MNFQGSAQKLKVVLSGTPAIEMDIILDYWLKDSTSGAFQLLPIDRATAGTSPVYLITGLGASESAIVESLVITNKDISAFVVSVIAEYGVVDRLWRTFNLNPGESMEWTKHSSWHLLEMNTSQGVAVFPIRTSDLVPAADNPIIYGMKICGRDILKMGAGDAIQTALWQNPPTIFIPKGTTGDWTNTTGVNMGTAAAAGSSAVNNYTLMRRQTFSSVVTTANQQVGTRSGNEFLRGSTVGVGGFFIVGYFGFQKWLPGNKLYAGLTVGTTTVVTGNPSALTNMFGFGVDAGDTAITLMHNDGAGLCVKEPIPSQPALANNQGYTLFIYCKPNSTVMNAALFDMVNNVWLYSQEISTELPTNTTFLNMQIHMSNGANVALGDASLGVGMIYIR